MSSSTTSTTTTSSSSNGFLKIIGACFMGASLSNYFFGGNLKATAIGSLVGMAVSTVIISMQWSKTIRTEIVINADKEKTFNILTDAARWPEWNSLCRIEKGLLKKGSWIHLTVTAVLGKPARHFMAEVTEFAPGRELRWRGCVGHPLLMTCDHGFRLLPGGAAAADAAGDCVRLVHFERFSGLLVPLAATTLDREAKPGFERMNAELKLRVEYFEE